LALRVTAARVTAFRPKLTFPYSCSCT